ncbi:MAG: hypothetical protein ACRC9T_04955 [Vibrionaceae bacterium]
MSKLSKFALTASLCAAMSLPSFAIAEEEAPVQEPVMVEGEAHDVMHDEAVYGPAMEDKANTEPPVVDQGAAPSQEEPMPEEFDEVPME